MLSLKVKTKKPYTVNIVEDFNIAEILSPLIKGENVCVITDTNVDKLYPDFFDELLKGKNVVKKVVAFGEESKCHKNYIDILNFLAQSRFTRNDTVITFGGGVVGDLGGFVASTYMRGINLIAIPTTLLSMVDSSVGGKTAINLDEGKNLCGTFYQPSGVIVCLPFIKTLPKKEVDCGLGEIAKYTFIDRKLEFNAVDEKLIYNCLKIKAKTVRKDETEHGKRKLLNFGHTFAHAIEKASNFTLPHGLCVAKGIDFAIRMSKNYFGLDEKLVKRWNEKLAKFNLDLTCKFSEDELIEIIYNDKKRNANGVDVVLIDKKNKLRIVNIPIEDIKRYL